MSRAVGMGLAGIGAAIVAGYGAARAGMLTGVALDWPAALFGAVVFVVGVVVALPGRDEAEAGPTWVPDAKGPLPESGLDAGLEREAAETASLDAQLRAEALRRRDPRADGGQ